MCELCPLSTGDLVHAVKGASGLQLLSGAPPLLCHKVAASIHLIDPMTMRGYDVSSVEFWRTPIAPCCTRKHLTEFVVLNVEDVEAPSMGTPARHHLAGRQKMRLSDIEVARV